MSDLASGRAKQETQAAFCVLIVDDDPDMAGLLGRMLMQQHLHFIRDALPSHGLMPARSNFVNVSAGGGAQ